MLLAIMIPAYNEENTISSVINDLKNIEPSMFSSKIDDVKIIVIDDGSSDKTSLIAKEFGADKVIRFNKNRGLAPAFKRGLDECLAMKADVIVNIDADGQYDTTQIPLLVNPILQNEADMVLGSRFLGYIEDMPFQKKMGNQIATIVTRFLSHYPTTDAQTGFRALSSELALRLNILSNYTYVQETIIKTNYIGYKIVEVPINFFKREGDGQSRLISNIFSYATKAGLVILTTYRDLYPLTFFGLIGAFLILMGAIFGVSVLKIYFVNGSILGKLPTALLSAFLVLLGSLSMLLGLIADMIKNQNILLSDLSYYIKKNTKI